MVHRFSGLNIPCVFFRSPHKIVLWHLLCKQIYTFGFRFAINNSGKSRITWCDGVRGLGYPLETFSRKIAISAVVSGWRSFSPWYNLVINGEMRIAQRTSLSSVRTANVEYSLFYYHFLATIHRTQRNNKPNKFYFLFIGCFMNAASGIIHFKTYYYGWRRPRLMYLVVVLGFFPRGERHLIDR